MSEILSRFIDWITGRTAMRKMFQDHDRKMLLLRQVRNDPLSVDRDEFRCLARRWAKEVAGKP